MAISLSNLPFIILIRQDQISCSFSSLTFSILARDLWITGRPRQVNYRLPNFFSGGGRRNKASHIPLLFQRLHEYIPFSTTILFSSVISPVLECCGACPAGALSGLFLHGAQVLCLAMAMNLAGQRCIRWDYDPDKWVKANGRGVGA